MSKEELNSQSVAQSIARVAAGYLVADNSRRARMAFQFHVPHVNKEKRQKTTSHSPNGLRECERRKRQIARGQLKKENGLVI